MDSIRSSAVCREDRGVAGIDGATTSESLDEILPTTKKGEGYAPI